MSNIPEAYFRNAIDLNRYSNSVSKELINSYNRIIIDAVTKLRVIDSMPQANQPAYKAARLKALLKQTADSLSKWSGKSSQTIIKEMSGLAQVQTKFAIDQLKAALPAGSQNMVRSVEVSPSFAEAVVSKKTTDLNASILSDDLKAKVKGVPGSFSLTAKKGAQIVLPNGDVVSKAFRGLASKQADLFGRTIRDGLLTGQTTQELSRRLIGRLQFGEKAKTVHQIAQAGGELTKMANHQVMTLVRTTVQQVSGEAAQTVYEANQDITKQYEWIATLDGRTAPECRALDGQEFEYGKGPTPPQHFRCRCRTAAVLDYAGLGVKPPKIKYSKRAAEGGSVPMGTTYGQWIQKQGVAKRAAVFGGKQEVLPNGKKAWRGKFQYFDQLAKKYGPNEALVKMVKADGSEKTLSQLAKAYGKDPALSKKLQKTPKVAKAPVKPTPKVAKAPVKTKPKKSLAEAITGEKKQPGELYPGQFKLEKDIADLNAKIEKLEKAAPTPVPTTKSWGDTGKLALEVHKDIYEEILKKSKVGSKEYLDAQKNLNEIIPILQKKGGKTYKKVKFKKGTAVNAENGKIFSGNKLDHWELEGHQEYWDNKLEEVSYKANPTAWKKKNPEKWKEIQDTLADIKKAKDKNNWKFWMDIDEDDVLFGLDDDGIPDFDKLVQKKFEPFKKKPLAELTDKEKQWDVLVKENQERLNKKSVKAKWKRKTTLKTDDVNYKYGLESDNADSVFFEDFLPNPPKGHKSWQDVLKYPNTEDGEIDMLSALQNVNDWTQGSGRFTRAQYALAEQKGIKLTPYARDQASFYKSIVSGKYKKNLKEFTEKIEAMEDFISRAPVYQGEIHRGINLPKSQLDECLEAFVRGKPTLTMESWSTNMAMAEEFAGIDAGVKWNDFINPAHKWAAGEDKVSVVMSVLKNKAGVPIKSTSSLAGEDEILLPSQMRYRVLEIQVGKAPGPRGALVDKVHVLLEQISN